MLIELAGLAAILSFWKRNRKWLAAAFIFLLAWPAEALQIDFEDAPVISVVQALAKSAGLNLVVSGDQASAQAKRTTVHLKNIEVEEAINNILRTNGFAFERKGDALLISSLPQDVLSTGYKMDNKVFGLKYLSASRAADLLGRLFPQALFQSGNRANSLVVRAKDSDLKEVAELLGSLDRQAAQILIEGKIVELSQSDSQKLGLSYGNGTVKFITDKGSKRTSLAEDLASALNGLIAEGKANVIASPRIATLDNQEALINIGNRIPYAVPVSSSGNTTKWAVEYLDAGVKLKITPQLGQDGDITTFIQPEVSAISEWRTTAAGDFPVISTRNASTTVRIKSGETVVIGGLLSETNRENITRVPLLGYLPIAGLFFQNRSIEKEKTEILFLITPRAI